MAPLSTLPSADGVRDYMQWSRRTLEVLPDASRADAARTLLRRLADQDFLPNEAEQFAAAILGGESLAKLPADPPPRLMAAHCTSLGAEIEAFAERFFELPPAERTRAWRELFNRCAGRSELELRLTALRPGLATQLPAADASTHEQRQTAAAIAELFVLTPPERRLSAMAVRARLQRTLCFSAVSRALDYSFPGSSPWEDLVPELSADLPTEGGFWDHLLPAPKPAEPPSPAVQRESNWLRIGAIALSVLFGLIQLVSFFEPTRKPAPPRSSFPARWEMTRHVRDLDPDARLPQRYPRKFQPAEKTP